MGGFVQRCGFWPVSGGLGAAPVPLHGPAFDTNGAHYVTVSIVREQKNLGGCVRLMGRLRNPSHLSMVVACSSRPRTADDVTAGVSLCGRRQMSVENVFTFCFRSFGFSRAEK